VIWNPLSVAGRPDVLFVAVVHQILCRSDSAILLDAQWASKSFALEVQSPNTPFWGTARRNITPCLFALLHVFRSTFRELGCLDPTTSVPCLVIFVFSEKRIGGVCGYHIVSVHAKSYDSSCDMGYAVLTPPAFACSCSARG